ncbi:MAG: tetratricopeptide repeat protein [Nitrospirota bacterium]
MWTYLAILFSLLLLTAVFVRRVFLYLKKNGPQEVFAKEEKEEVMEKAKNLSMSETEDVEELAKKAESALKVGKEEEAIKYFVQALAIDALHLETQHKLAMLYMKKEMFGAAAALFKSLGDLTGEAVHYSHQGLALYQQNLFEEAKVAYQKAVDLDPSRPERFVSLAQVYRSLGQLNNAIVALNKAIEIEEESLDFLFLLIDLQAELGNFNEALEMVGKVLELDPKNEEAISYIKTLKAARKQAQEE